MPKPANLSVLGLRPHNDLTPTRALSTICAICLPPAPRFAILVAFPPNGDTARGIEIIGLVAEVVKELEQSVSVNNKEGSSPVVVVAVEPNRDRRVRGAGKRGAAECRRGDYCRGVPPNFQRFLPFVLLALVALFVLPALLKKHTSGPSASTRATQTIDAMNLIDKGEQAYKTVHGRFTRHLADLLPLNTRLANDLAVGLAVQLDVSTNGQRFLAEVASNVLSVVRARGGAKITAQSCLILKSGSGVKCPAPVS